MKEVDYGLHWFRDGKLYHVFSNNLYMCPFCKENFIGIYQDNVFCTSEFTLDHYPPQSVGGKKKALVCKKCNNNYGLEVDHVLEDYLKSKSFVSQGSEKVRTSFQYSDTKGKYKGQIYWNKGALVMELPFKKYPLAKEWVSKRHTVDSKINFTFSVPSDKLLIRALLRVAYLIFFEFRGYEFVIHPVGLNMYDAIEGKEDFFLKDAVLKTGDPLPNGINLIVHPKELSCLIVSFQIALKSNEQFENVQIVVPHSNNKEDLLSAQEFIEHGRNGKKIDIKFERLKKLLG